MDEKNRKDFIQLFLSEKHDENKYPNFDYTDRVKVNAVIYLIKYPIVGGL